MRDPRYVKDCLTFEPLLTPYKAMSALTAIQEDIEGGTHEDGDDDVDNDGEGHGDHGHA